MGEHSVPISSMAEVLEVKEEALESLVRCPPSPASSCSAMSTTSDAALDSQILKFEHVFEFLVNDAGHAELTFVLMKKRKSSKQVDKCIVPISDILSAHQRTLTTNLEMLKSGVVVELRLEARLLGSPAEEMWFDAEGSLW